MALTLQQANEALTHITTVEGLRNLINQLSVEASGKVTILYSGMTTTGDLISNAELMQGMLRNGEDIRVIDGTDAAKFLQADKDLPGYNRALEVKLGELGIAGKPMERGTPANQFLFGEVDAQGRRLPNGAWDNVSARFVDATVGEVRTLTGGANAERVFGQTEIPHALDNKKITSIDGIPRADLESMGSEKAFKTIAAQSEVMSSELRLATNADGSLYRDTSGHVRVDSRDFFEMTGLEGKAPLVDAGHYDAMGRWMPDRLEQHREGIEQLQEVKSKYTALEHTPDLPGVDHSATRAVAGKVLGKLGWAGDLLALGLAAKDANAAYDRGDKAAGNKIMVDWAAEFGGGLAGGLLAAKLMGSALTPLYLTGPVGAAIAGGLTLLAGIGGGIFGGEGAKNLIDYIKKQFGSAQTADPLILDLDGDGVETLGQTRGVHFDHDGNRFAELTGWVGKDDGLLVLDRNGNGKIDSGAELFGDQTVLKTGDKAGQKAGNGFEALKELDLNQDGVIDAKDAAYAQLKVWRDGNSNGVTEAGELLTLAAAKVGSIKVAYTTGNAVDAQGNQHLQLGSYTGSDGKTRAMTDVWFSQDLARTVDLDTVAVSAEIAKLPDLQGLGNVRSLHQAMAHDATGQLKGLLSQWMVAKQGASREALFDQLLYTWAGAQAVDPKSRGSYIDGRQLVTAEAFVGQKFIRSGSDSPSTGFIAQILIDAYQALRKAQLLELRWQTDFDPWLDQVKLTWIDATANSTGKFGFDIRDLVKAFETELTSNFAYGRQNILSFGEALREHQMSDLITTLNAQAQSYQTTNPSLSFVLKNLGSAAPFIYGGSADDTLAGGAGNDWMDAGSGNDQVTAGSGADVLRGGTGNDTLAGGTGADEYQFSVGDGVDIIRDYDETAAGVTDKIAFNNVASTSLRGLERRGDDLVIKYGVSDQITVEGYFVNAWWGSFTRIEQISFSDGVTWKTADLWPRIISYGTTGDDTIAGYNDAGNRTYGLAGNDTVYGGTQADWLDGGAGNDSLNADAGVDTLVGGVGNDTLYGGAGNDVYRFAVGDGLDVVSEYDSTSGNVDTVVFTNVKSTELRGLECTGSDLVIKYGTADQVSVENYFNTGYGSTYRIEQISFSDGVTWKTADFIPKVITYGTAGNDTIYGYNDAGNRTYALAGHDTVSGGTQADWLDGGAGNDSLNADAGVDTLVGGAGNDVYRFAVGDGLDVVSEDDNTSGNMDTVVFTNVKSTELRGLERTGNDLVIKYGTSDQVTVAGLFDPNYSAYYRIEQISFSDGVAWKTADFTPKVITYGTASDDNIRGYNDAGNRTYALAGDDQVYGGTQADWLDGGAGSDSLSADAGVDTLIGGVGNDTLYGGAGNDVYRFAVGDGLDVVSEYDSTSGNVDTVVFTNVKSTELRGLERRGEDLVIKYGTSDQVSVENFFNTSYGPMYRIEQISFSDGVTWGNLQVGSSTADGLLGTAHGDLLWSGAGNDTLTGGLGLDVLAGGLGADRFVLNASAAASNVKSIVDFSKAEGDVLALASPTFTALAGKTSLAPHFRLSSQAVQGNNDYLVYNSSTGQLFYDAVGDGKALSLLATLQNKPQDLTASQFVVL